MAASSRPRQGAHSRNVLGELSVGNIQNIKPAIESLNQDLDNLHIHSPVRKENISEILVSSCQGIKHRPALEATSPCRAASTTPDISHPLRGTSNTSSGAGINTTKHSSQGKTPGGLGMSGVTCANHAPADFESNNPLALASQQLPSTQAQLWKHQEGQFEWLLSIPVNASAKERGSLGDSRDDTELPRDEKRLYFGCNLVHRRTQSGASPGKAGRPANIYTLLATRVEGAHKFRMDGVAASADQPHHSETTVAEPQTGTPELPKSPETALVAKDDGASEHLLVSQPPRPLSRIEDSVEELDKLEEELEALNEVAQLGQVASPEPTKVPVQGINEAETKSTPLKRASSVRTAASSVKGKSVARSSSVRKPTSVASTDEDGTTTRKVPRPTSLLPPKPPAKSSKPPTVAAFELPGEAVARRLKEQREARRSQHITPEQAAAVAAAYSPSKPHVKSTKPPTRPTFELPGDAISRRKREEREAKLRAQEEEERKRREFKARPIRASIVPSSAPRETLASLARRDRAAGSGSSESATPTPTVKKRHSTAVPSSSSKGTASSASQQQQQQTRQPARGRETQKQPQQQNQPTSSSRATSTSTGSIHSGGSKRSTVSAEEAQQQKMRGKEIFSKDNSYAADRERERREREEATRLARQEAAERSRQLSREWKEKQEKMKKLRDPKEKVVASAA
ncbi:hypothetical protein MFIFM68171_03538 [Madurella fahalii]|uniref:Carboxylesterase family protein n=1 Tax=Madurella fahalii TaxID=1157608 RepID=A0ABQ0G6E6_9PEZI